MQTQHNNHTQFQPFQDNQIQSKHSKCTQFQSLQDHYHKHNQNASSEKIPHKNLHKSCLTPKSHHTTPCQCPYSRPQQTKPSNPQPKHISRPPPTAEICLNQLLTHLISLNGNPQSNTVSQNTSFQDPSPPTFPQTQSSSSSSSYKDPDSEPEATSSSICTADTESLSGQSTASTCSDRQLRPRLPIQYNKTFFMRLQGRPQVTVMPTLSIPLPLSSSEEEDMDSTEPL